MSPRVLMVLPRLPVAEDWVDAAARHHDVTAVDLQGQLLPRTFREPTGERSPWPVGVLRVRPARWFWRVNASLAGRRLATVVDALAEAGRPVELAHGHFFSGSGGLPGLRRLRGIPYVVSEHSSALTSANPEKSISPTGLRLAERVYRDAAAVLPVSASLAAAIEQRGLVTSTRTVPNPVDTDRFRPGPLPDRPRITTVARLARVKQLDVLLRAVAELQHRGADPQVGIVGDGPERVPLQALARDLGIEGAVTFHGRLDRDQVAAILATSTVFALSSHTENLPVAAIEALSAGLPVVAPAVGGLPELLADAPGALVRPGDAEDLARGLERWLEPMPADRDRARELVVGRYSVDAVGELLRDVYAAAASADAAARASR